MPTRSPNSKPHFIHDFAQLALPSFKFNMSQMHNSTIKGKDLLCQIIAKDDINIVSFNTFSINACNIIAKNNFYIYSSEDLYMLGGYQGDDMLLVYTTGSISFIANNGASLSSFGINKATESSVNVRRFYPLQDDDKLVIHHSEKLYVYTSNPVDFLHNVVFNKADEVYIYHPYECSACEAVSQNEQFHYDL